MLQFSKCTLVFLSIISLVSAGDTGETLKAARKAEKSGQVERAFQLYAEIAAQEAGQAPVSSGGSSADASVDGDPDDPGEPALGVITPKELAEARIPQPPQRLKPSAVITDFDIRGDDKTIYEQVAKAYGYLVVFDKDFQPSPPLRFKMSGVDYREALHALEAVTSTFIVPAADRLFLVARDTAPKRTELESTMSIMIPLPDTVQVQEAQEIALAVRSTMDIQRLIVDAAQRAVLIRDRVSKVRPAQMIFEDLLQHRAEIMIELEFLSANGTSALKYGLSLPTSFPLVDFGRIGSGNILPSIPSGITKFLVFGGGSTFFGIGITNAQLFASVSRSQASSIMKSQMLSVDGQPATLHLGDKYPIVSSIYSGTGTLGGSGFPPSVTFEDLGVVLKITPHAHGLEAVSLDVEAEFKTLSGSTFNDIPVIVTRKFQTKVRLETGQWAVMAGLMTNSKSKSQSGLAGLSSIPLLGALLRQNTVDSQNTEMLLVIKPRLVNLPPTEMLTHTLWVGSETRPVTPL